MSSVRFILTWSLGGCFIALLRHFNIGDIEVTQKMLRHISHICDGSFMVEHYVPVVRGILVAEANSSNNFNTLNAELNPICYFPALLAHHFLHVSRIRVKSLTLRLLMSYIYI